MTPVRRRGQARQTHSDQVWDAYDRLGDTGVPDLWQRWISDEFDHGTTPGQVMAAFMQSAALMFGTLAALTEEGLTKPDADMFGKQFAVDIVETFALARRRLLEDAALKGHA